MTERLIALEVNCATGETIERELTAEEIAFSDKTRKEFLELEAQRQAEAQAKAQAKASAESKLAALGLSAEEIAALK